MDNYSPYKVIAIGFTQKPIFKLELCQKYLNLEFPNHRNLFSVKLKYFNRSEQITIF